MVNKNIISYDINEEYDIFESLIITIITYFL